MRYYESLISYLGSQNPLYMTVTVSSSNDWFRLVKRKQEAINDIPDVIILELYLDKDNYSMDAASRDIKRKTEFDLEIKDEAGKKRKILYSLDSAVIRNTEQHHFATTITCNKKEFAFDGMSFSRLVPFSWKNKLNADSDWSFEYKNTEKLYFNFASGYQLLFYYRQ